MSAAIGRLRKPSGAWSASGPGPPPWAAAPAIDANTSSPHPIRSRVRTRLHDCRRHPFLLQLLQQALEATAAAYTPAMSRPGLPPPGASGRVPHLGDRPRAPARPRAALDAPAPDPGRRALRDPRARHGRRAGRALPGARPLDDSRRRSIGPWTSSRSSGSSATPTGRTAARSTTSCPAPCMDTCTARRVARAGRSAWVRLPRSSARSTWSAASRSTCPTSRSSAAAVSAAADLTRSGLPPSTGRRRTISRRGPPP